MSHPTMTVPAGPRPAERTSDLFGSVWTRSIGVCCAAGGLLGTPLVTCIGWTHGRMPTLVEMLFIALVGLFVGALAGLPLGAVAALALCAVVRRHPPIWRAVRAARIVGTVIGGATGVLFAVLWSMTTGPSVVFTGSALLVGWLLSARLITDYGALADGERR